MYVPGLAVGRSGGEHVGGGGGGGGARYVGLL